MKSKLKLRFYYFLILLISIANISCINTQKKDPSLSFFIEVGVTYKYDLGNGLYIIGRYKGDTTIHFTFTADEKEKIISKYYSLHLDKLNSKEFNDKCGIMPTIFTTLSIKRDNKTSQKITIDESCDDLYINNFIDAYRVKKFLRFVWKILLPKPEIKNAPNSDIILM